MQRLRTACCAESPIDVEAHVQQIVAVVWRAKLRREPLGALLDRIIDLERRIESFRDQRNRARRSRDLWQTRALRYQSDLERLRKGQS